MNERKERNFELELKVSSIELLLNFIQRSDHSIKGSKTKRRVKWCEGKVSQSLANRLLPNGSL